MEEISTTLRKHLRKEEEQLLPLLLAHFTTGEQAELVAQFLCSIPLSTVEVRLGLALAWCWCGCAMCGWRAAQPGSGPSTRNPPSPVRLQQVLGWLRRQMPAAEQAALREQLRRVVADRLLQQLLLAWLSPPAAADDDSAVAGTAAGAAVAAAAAEPMALDGAGSPREQLGAAPPSTLHGQQACDIFVCCRAGGPAACAAGSAGSSGSGKGGAGTAAAGHACRYDRDLEEAGLTPGNKPPLRVSDCGGEGRLCLRLQRDSASVAHAD